MLDREAAAGDVVGRDGDVRRVVRRRVRVDDGDGDVVAEGGARVGLPPHDDDAVDAAVEQRTEVVLLADRVAAGVAEEHVHLPGAERVLGAHEDRDHEAALEVAREEADGAGAAGDEAARELVRRERQFLGGGDDALARGGRHLVAPVDGLRRGGERHPREARDIAQRGRPAAGGVCSSHPCRPSD